MDGGELLVWLRRIPGRGFAEQAKPVARWNSTRKPGGGEPIKKQPTVGNSAVFQLRRSKPHYAADSHVGQVQGLVLTNDATATGLEPIDEQGALIDLHCIGVQGGAGVVTHRCAGAVEHAADVGASQN